VSRRARARTEAGRFLRFSVVGALGAVVDFGVFNLLHARAGLAEVAASIVSFLAAVTSNFIWNRYWTYPGSRTKSVRRQAAQFALVSAVGLLIRTPVLALLLAPATALAEQLVAGGLGGGLRMEAGTLGDNLALASAVVVVLFWNFLANRLWTYGDVDAGRTSASEAEAPPV